MRRSLLAAVAVLVVVACGTLPALAQTIDPAALQRLIDALQTTVQQLQQLIPVPPGPVPPPVIVRVPVGGNLQAAIDAASSGTTILIAPGTYTGNFVLRKKPSAIGSAPITLRTDGLDDSVIGPTTRVMPALAPRVAKLAVLDSLAATLNCEDGAHDYVVIGIEVLGNAKNPDRDSVICGTLDMTTLAQVPVNITFDRMYIHGDATAGGHRGVNFNAINWKILNSYISGYVERNRDSQAVLTANAPGPGLILNTYLEATGENFLTGGVDPHIPNVLPADITLRGNYVFKPLAWKTTATGSVKNLLELKLGKRILIENNVFENCWPDAQAGDAIQLTNRNNDLTAPWSTIQDVVFRYNVIKNVQGAGFRMLGIEDRPGVVDVQGTNLTIENNLLVNVSNGMLVNNGFRPTTVRHNTFVTTANWFLQMIGNPIPTGQFTYQDNLTMTGEWAITGDGTTGVGTATLNKFAPGAVFDHNVIEQSNAQYQLTLPAGNTMLSAGQLAGRFDSRRRYTGSELGHDGVKVGADIDGIIARIPWATW